MTTAFVLSGGGSLGAVQVGMLQALEERGVRPDLLIGTSAGAVNAAYLAAHGCGTDSLEQLASIWRGLRRQTVFPFDPLRYLLAFRGTRLSLCSNGSLRRLIQSHMVFRDLEQAKIPLRLVATDLLTGEEVLLSTGDALSAVLASSAIPGVLPPITREGLTLVDGGVSDNTALSQAVELGADEIWVLAAGYACDLDRPPDSALGIALHALTLVLEQRLIVEVAQFRGPARLKILPPLCPLSVTAIDFGHAADLIERAHDATGRWIDTGGPSLEEPQRFLSFHRHAPGEHRVHHTRHTGTR